MSLVSTRSRRHLVLMVALTLVVGNAVGARADYLIADLSDHRIEITSGFTGAEVLLFGTREGDGDIVVVLRGPPEPLVVRRKSRTFGLWLNRDSMVFTDAPGYYAVAANRPLAEIAAPGLLEDLAIGFENLPLELYDSDNQAELATFRTALLRNMGKVGLYSGAIAQIRFVGSQLFRTTFELPANVPTGLYHADIFLIDNGALVSRRTTALQIRKSGFEAALSSFAQYQPLLYGLVAVVVALVAGWTAGMVFRKG